MGTNKNLTWLLIIIGIFLGSIITVFIFNFFFKVDYKIIIPIVSGGIISYIIFMNNLKIKNRKKLKFTK